MIFQRKPKYAVIPISEPRLMAPVEGDELRAGLRTLQANPFFKYLLSRLRLQKSALEARHAATRYKALDECAFSQQGIFWTGWLEAELNRLTEEPPKPSLSATDQEEEAFAEIDRLLQRVGVEGVE